MKRRPCVERHREFALCLVHFSPAWGLGREDCETFIRIRSFANEHWRCIGVGTGNASSTAFGNPSCL